MSIEPTPAPAAAPALPAAPTGSVLPEGVKVDHSHSADGFFERQQAVNRGEPAPAPKPAVIAPTEAPPKPDPTPAPAPEPAKGSLVAKLAKPKVANPAATPAPAAKTEGFLEKLETAPDPEPGKAGEHFKNWKGQAKHEIVSLQTKLKEVETQLTAAKATPAVVPNEEVEKLRAEHKVMSDRLLIIDVQAHPAFKTQFTVPKQAAVSAAQQLLKDGAVEGVDVAALLDKPRAEFGKAVAEAGAKLNDFDRVDFAEQMRKAYAVAQQEKEALGRSKETLTAIQQGNSARAQNAFAAVEHELMAKTGEFLPALEPAEGATAAEVEAIESYNQAVKELPGNARKLALETSDEKSVASSAFKAAAYDLHINHVLPRIMAEHDAVLQVNKHLTDEITAIRSRNPNIGRHAPIGGGDGKVDPSKMTHAEAAEYFMNGGARQ